MKRTRIAIVLGLGLVLVVCLMALLANSSAPSGDWLQMVSGPSLRGATNAGGDQAGAIIFTISNAGPRALRFNVDKLEWRAKKSDARGTYDVTSGLTLLQSGGSAVLTTKSVGTVPPSSEILAGWDIAWWEEPTAIRQFLDQVEAYLPFSLSRRQLASGMLSEWQLVPPKERWELKYGLSARVTRSPIPDAERVGPANGSQPIRSETNRTSSAAGSRR